MPEAERLKEPVHTCFRCLSRSLDVNCLTCSNWVSSRLVLPSHVLILKLQNCRKKAAEVDARNKELEHRRLMRKQARIAKQQAKRAEVSQAVPQGVPQAAPQAIPQAVPQVIPQAAPQAIPHAGPQAIPQAIPQSVPQATAQAVPQASKEPTQALQPVYLAPGIPAAAVE
jgi:hypothetical protein